MSQPPGSRCIIWLEALREAAECQARRWRPQAASRSYGALFFLEKKVFAGFYVFYYTEELGLAITAAALINVIYGIWDAIDDLLVGFPRIIRARAGAAARRGGSGFETLEHRTADALAALKYLQSRADIKPNAVGLWGVS